MRLSAILILSVFALAMAVPGEVNAQTRFGACGQIKEFTSSSASSAGSLLIGTRRIIIAAGASTSVVNLLPQVGNADCVIGTVNPSGEFVEFGSLGTLPPEVCGTVTGYSSVAAGAAGWVELSDTTTYLIPVGTEFPVSVSSGHHCFATGLDTRGDAIVVREVNPVPPRPGMGEGPATRSTLPATATEPGSAPGSTAFVLGLMVLIAALGIAARIASGRKT